MNTRSITPLLSRGRRRAGLALVAGAAVSALAVGCSSSPAEAPAADDVLPLIVGVRDVSTSVAPLYWAEAEGYFDDAGLDVSIRPGEAAHTAQLVAGQTDLYWGAEGGLLGVIDSGKPVQTIYGVNAGAFGYVVASSDAIRTPADCTTVTTATPGTVVYAWTRQLEAIYDAQWELSQLTTVPAVSANVAGGRTECAVGNVNWYQTAIEDGRLHIVLDPGDQESLPDGWPTLGVEDVIGGLPDVLEQKRPAVERFLEAYALAVQDYLETDATEIAETLSAADAAWAAVGTVDVLAITVDKFKPFLNPGDGYVSEETWANTLSFFETGGLEFLEHDADRFAYDAAVDMSYYDAGTSGR